MNGCKLSNYGDTLKLITPNYTRKSICGWTNHSGMVTDYKIDEKKIGNRVSKSNKIFICKRATSRR
jgi:hypothetical protein